MKRIICGLSMAVIATLFFSLDSIAQHGQKVRLQTRSFTQRSWFRSKQATQLVVIMTNFPNQVKVGDPSPYSVFWKLIDEEGFIVEMKDGKESVALDITKLPDGNYSLVNHYFIWREGPKLYDHPYEYTVGIPLRIFTVVESHGGKTKSFSSNSCDADGYFLGKWSRIPRLVGGVKASIKENSGTTIICEVPDTNNMFFLNLISMKDFVIVKKGGRFKSSVEVDITGLKPGLYIVRAGIAMAEAIMAGPDDYYQTVKVLQVVDGRLTLQDVFNDKEGGGGSTKKGKRIFHPPQF